MLSKQQFYLLCQIQTSQTGGHLYSDTSPYAECCLVLRTSGMLGQKIRSLTAKKCRMSHFWGKSATKHSASRPAALEAMARSEASLNLTHF